MWICIQAPERMNEQDKQNTTCVYTHEAFTDTFV